MRLCEVDFMKNDESIDKTFLAVIFLVIIGVVSIGFISNMTDSKVCSSTVNIQGSPYLSTSGKLASQGNLNLVADELNNLSMKNLGTQFDIKGGINNGNITITEQHFCRDNWMVAFINWCKLEQRFGLAQNYICHD